MRTFFLLFGLFTMSSFIHASEIPFYLGTYTKDTTSKGIYLSRLDAVTGKFSPATLAGECLNPGFLAFSPDRKFLYAAMEDKESAVAAFRVNPDRSLT